MRLSPWLGLWLCGVWACSGSTAELRGMHCTRDEECGELVCAADGSRQLADLAELPLVCAERRAGAGAPFAACSEAKDCERGVCLLAGACARSCAETRDCAPDERCQSVYARRDQGGFTQLTACVANVDLPGDAQVLRELRPDAVSGAVDSLRLPPWAAQTLYVLEHADPDWPVPSSTSPCRPPLCARSLRTEQAPERALFDAAQLRDAADGPDLTVALGKHVNPLTVWAPNGPRLSAEARAYLLEVESTHAGDVQLSALARPTRGQRLDLNLYYVGARDLAPEGARGPAAIAAALDEVDRIFEPADIFIGEVRQTLVSGALLERGAELPQAQASAGFARLRSQYQVLPQLPELLKLSAGAANCALDVFFVADIDAQGGADVGGIAGGTPLAFGMHGTPGSGIAIATDMYLDAAATAQLGRTLAHELGHALGLFHTTEVDGWVLDPLPDTPACSLAQDSDHDGALSAVECAAHGGDNLMFATSDAGDALTEQQRQWLRAALILQ